MEPEGNTEGSLFGAAFRNTFDWALGYPVNEVHFLFGFLVTVVGGFVLFRKSAASMNALNWGLGAAVPCWAVGVASIFLGMTIALVTQPQSSADSPRLVVAAVGGGIAMLVVAAPMTMYFMSMGYFTAVSSWLTVIGCWGMFVGANTMIGAGMIEGKPKVLMWQGDVFFRVMPSAPWRAMTHDRKILPVGSELATRGASATVVYVRGNHILLLPDSSVRIPDIGDNPRVEILSGRIYSKASIAASRNMRYRTRGGYFHISGDDLLLAVDGRQNSTVVVSDGGIYYSRDESGSTSIVGKGQMAVIPSGGVREVTPQTLPKKVVDELRKLEHYFSNPFASHSRRMITGELAPPPKKKAPGSVPEKKSSDDGKPPPPKSDDGKPPVSPPAKDEAKPVESAPKIN